jgi:MFS family permease
VLGSAFFCYAALGSVVRILPSYVPHDLHAGAVAVGAGVGAPALAAIFTRPLGGRLADRVGPLRVLLAGAAGMAAAAPLALVRALPLLLLSRLLVGAGEGLMMSATALWLLRLGGEQRRGRSIGHVGLANYGGLVAGPLLAQAIAGEAHPARVFLAGVALPLIGAACALAAGDTRARAAEAGPTRDGGRRATVREVLSWTLRPGIGLLLVNTGYAALISFGALALAANGAHAGSLVVPVFAAGVIVVRALAGSLPDRVGAQRTLLLACPLAGAGLAGVALAPGTAVAVSAIGVLATGQALAVPALGAIALRAAPSSEQGATAGLFFAWFDAGVGIGGPLAGGAAALEGASGALDLAAVLVLLTLPAAGVWRGSRVARRRPRAARRAAA